MEPGEFDAHDVCREPKLRWYLVWPTGTIVKTLGVEYFVDTVWVRIKSDDEYLSDSYHLLDGAKFFKNYWLAWAYSNRVKKKFNG